MVRHLARSTLGSAPPPRSSRSIAVRKVDFHGHAATKLETDRIELVCVHDVGPRLASFSEPGGQNLLFWDEQAPPRRRIQHHLGREDWILRGGHRLWLSPHRADEASMTYHPDNEPAEVTVLKDGLRVTAAVDRFTEVLRGFEIRVTDDDRVIIDHFAKNVGEMLFAAGLWGLTCTRPREDSIYVAPLGDGSEWDSISVTLYRRWANQGPGDFKEDQFSAEADAYVLRPRGKACKRSLLNPSGLLAMVDPSGKRTFVIESQFETDRAYPADANQALYVGSENFMVEMETMGPLVQLKPGAEARHREVWSLHEGAVHPTGAAVRELVQGSRRKGT